MPRRSLPVDPHDEAVRILAKRVTDCQPRRGLVCGRYRVFQIHQHCVGELQCLGEPVRATGGAEQQGGPGDLVSAAAAQTCQPVLYLAVRNLQDYRTPHTRIRGVETGTPAFTIYSEGRIPAHNSRHDQFADCRTLH